MYGPNLTTLGVEFATEYNKRCTTESQIKSNTIIYERIYGVTASELPEKIRKVHSKECLTI